MIVRSDGASGSMEPSPDISLEGGKARLMCRIQTGEFTASVTGDEFGGLKAIILNWFNCFTLSARLEAFIEQIGRILKNLCGLRDPEYLFIWIQDPVAKS
jgi:hypothetical protein